MNLLPCIALSLPGPGEWIPILLVVMLFFGAKRLPDLARSLGKSLSEFKKGREEGPGKPDGEAKDADDAKDSKDKGAG
jgi:sec-independent protein translocase protein TatA